MIGSFVELQTRGRRVRLRLASGVEVCGLVQEVADDGGWLAIEPEDGSAARLYVNTGRVDWFQLEEG